MQSAHDDHREESTREIIGGTSCIPQKNTIFAVY